MMPRDTARQLRADPTSETIRTVADTLDALSDWLDVTDYAADLPSPNRSGVFLRAWVAGEIWALADFAAHKAALA